MKKERLFVATLAAIAFSACSDDKGNSDPGGCLLKNEGVNFECIEEDANYGSKQTCASLHGEWVSSCPSGGIKCELESSGIKFVATFYDEEYNFCSQAILNNKYR
jgi:hypothetical protein